MRPSSAPPSTASAPRPARRWRGPTRRASSPRRRPRRLRPAPARGPKPRTPPFPSSPACPRPTPPPLAPERRLRRRPHRRRPGRPAQQHHGRLHHQARRPQRALPPRAVGREQSGAGQAPPLFHAPDHRRPRCPAATGAGRARRAAHHLRRRRGHAQPPGLRRRPAPGRRSAALPSPVAAGCALRRRRPLLRRPARRFARPRPPGPEPFRDQRRKTRPGRPGERHRARPEDGRACRRGRRPRRRRGAGVLMQRALSTHLFVNHKLTTETLRKVEEAGIPALEIFSAKQHFDYTDASQEPALPARFRDHALQLRSLHSPLYKDYEWGKSHSGAVVNLAEPERLRRLQSVDEVKRCLETAEQIPLRYLVQPLGIPHEDFALEKFDAAYSSLESLHLFAKQRGVLILLENIPNELSTPQRLLEFLHYTRMSELRPCFDP